jgi:hypothetical protein
MKCGLVLVVLLAGVGLATAQNIPATLSVDGKPVLELTVPATAKLTATNGYLKVISPKLELYIWAVPRAESVTDAVPRAADVIKREFIKFEPAATNDVQIAGAPAKDLTGPGNEADDEDEGNAEVVFFALDGRVFAACIHGEFDDAKPEHTPMLAILNTAKAPGTSP